MATVQSLLELSDTLTDSLKTLSATLPPADSLLPPKDGISLLDTKNELLLSYLLNVSFLITIKIRHAKAKALGSSVDGDTNNERKIMDQVVKRIVELRVYLERGVRPLEQKLLYQIDKAVRAATDYEQRAQKTTTNGKASKEHATTTESSASSSKGDSEADSDASDNAIANGASNLASFARPSASQSRSAASARDTDNKSGVYRPPRIAPVAPPSDIPRPRERKQGKSHLLDEYITSELSVAPVAEPSIGANIIDRGRRDVLSTRERAVAADRQRYEEENLIRLPGMGKKERRKLDGDRAKRGQFGGEEWSGLGGSAERIVQLTGRRGGSGGTRGALERSRKRGREDDGGGASGAGIGERFERKRRTLEKRSRR